MAVGSDVGVIGGVIGAVIDGKFNISSPGKVGLFGATLVAVFGGAICTGVGADTSRVITVGVVADGITGATDC